MALDETPKEVTVMIYVDGVLHNSCTRHLPAYAVDYASQAAVIQIDDPDLDAALDEIAGHDGREAEDVG